ncbi:hypothetical protein [Streptomyces sp. CC208A]|uniref:hypothetical protein n=1 Tax=Streptomyces sp. CC208A TaxID=3044573 RepID=UPI0024A8369C|nr:hypothetical protein [Streptomyces sp. CC208A]
MARVYATATQYETYTGLSPAPTDIDVRLRRASAFLDAQVFRYCRYATDNEGLPADPLVAAAFADAVCAQVEWGIDVGDTTGAAGVGWGKVQVGSVRLERPTAASASGGETPGRQVAPAVWDALQSPGLGPERLYLGLVVSC